MIRHPSGTIIGLDIGGSKTAVVEGDPATGATLQRHELPTEASTPFTARFPAIAAIIDQTRKTAERAGRSIAAISVSVGGPLRIDEGVLLDPPHLPGWHGAPIRAALSDRYSGVSVYVEHDGNAGALAEYRFGVGREHPSIRHLVFLTAGTGLGGGVIANGALLRGASDTAGEFGFFPVAAPDAEGRWVAGSWDALASGAGLLRHAGEMFPARWGADAGGGGRRGRRGGRESGSAGKEERGGPTIRTIVDAALADDPDALAVVERTGEWLGRGLVLVLAAVNPEVVVVGTLGVTLGERLLGPARAILAAQALPPAFAACKLMPSTFGTGIGDVAAIMGAIAARERRE